MGIIKNYISNIVLFVLLSAIVELILPDIKLKKYINLVMGLILIIIIISPIKSVLNNNFKSLDLLVLDNNFNIEKNSIDYMSDANKQKQKEMIIKTYKHNLEKQSIDILKGKDYLLIDCNIDINEDIDSDDFGIIENISLVVREEYKESIIKPVNINLSKQVLNSIDGDNKQNNIKKLFSDFYNLSLDNINISIQK